MPRLVIVLALLVGAASCSAGSPEVPAGPDGVPDPVLVEGRAVWDGRCSNCHGSSGGGGRGPKLSDGRVVEEYPDIADQIAVVVGGRGSMPSFENALSGSEIEAVVRYTREVLSLG